MSTQEETNANWFEEEIIVDKDITCEENEKTCWQDFLPAEPVDEDNDKYDDQRNYGITPSKSMNQPATHFNRQLRNKARNLSYYKNPIVLRREHDEDWWRQHSDMAYMACDKLREVGQFHNTPYLGNISLSSVVIVLQLLDKLSQK